MIPRTSHSRSPSPLRQTRAVPRTTATLLASSGPIDARTVCVLLMGIPDHTTNNLLAHYQQEADDRGLGFLAVICPETDEGIARSLIPMLAENIEDDALFIVVDPGAGTPEAETDRQAVALSESLIAHGFPIDAASCTLVDAGDPHASTAVRSLHRMANALLLLRQDDDPDAQRALAILGDPDESPNDNRLMLNMAALHYSSGGREPLLPIWHRLHPPPATESHVARAQEASGTPLADALYGWISLHDAEVTSPGWQAIEHLDGSSTFVDLLDRLNDMHPDADNPDIQHLLRRLVGAMRADAAFAAQVIAICVGATETCDDRVSLVLSQLECALMARKVACGHHDDDPGQAIHLARQVFRRMKIDEIGKAKVDRIEEGLPSNGRRPGIHREALETHLAYLHGLHEVLGLDGMLPEARYTGEVLSGVSPQDLEHARNEVQNAENRHFTAALADWTPWQQLLERLDPEGVAALKQELADPDFWLQVEQEVKAVALEAMTPAADLPLVISTACNRRAIELTRERWVALTIRLLHGLGLDDLLKPAWD